MINSLKFDLSTCYNYVSQHNKIFSSADKNETQEKLWALKHEPWKAFINDFNIKSQFVLSCFKPT
jgi:hypothetical protein